MFLAGNTVVHSARPGLTYVVMCTGGDGVWCREQGTQTPHVFSKSNLTVVGCPNANKTMLGKGILQATRAYPCVYVPVEVGGGAAASKTGLDWLRRHGVASGKPAQDWVFDVATAPDATVPNAMRLWREATAGQVGIAAVHSGQLAPLSAIHQQAPAAPHKGRQEAVAELHDQGALVAEALVGANAPLANMYTPWPCLAFCFQAPSNTSPSAYMAGRKSKQFETRCALRCFLVVYYHR